MNATDNWYDVSRLTDRSYSIVEGDGYGMFLVEGAERSLLVDAGTGVGDLRGLVSGLVDTPVALFLTHTHWDHIGAASQFDDVRVHPAELPADGRVAIDSLTDEFTHRPTQFANRWLEDGNELPDSVDPDAHSVDPVAAEAVDPDGEFDLGDRSLDFHHLPGHAPGHTAVRDPDDGVLYGGDIVHFEKNLYIMFQDCDLDDYLDSLVRLRDLRDEGAFEVLATNHNEPMQGSDLDLIDDLVDGLREIAAGEREYEVVDTDWGEARSYQVGPSEILTKTDL